MKLRVGGLVVAALLLLALPVAAGKRISLRGWVSDEACGTLHVKPGREDCVRKCRRGGAAIGHPEWTPQRLVLVTDTDEKIWIVENPESLNGREGRHVEVQATVDTEKHSLRVESVTEIAPPATP